MNHLNLNHQPRTFRKRNLVWITGLVMAMNLLAFPDAWAQQVSPTNLTFQAVQGGTNPPSQTVNVFKNNSRPLDWSSADSAAWLSVSPTSGSLRRSAQMSVSVTPAGLAAGTYSATVTITVSNGGSFSVPVTLTVTSGSTTGSTPSSTSSGSGTTTSPPPSSTSSGSGTTTSPPPTSTSSGTGTTANLTWNASTSSNVAGYKVYMGTSSGVYGSPLNAGNLTSYVLSNLSVGSTYYFAVTAYNSSGIESGFSNEVSKSIY